MRRSACAFSAAALLSTSACAGRGLSFASGHVPVDSALLLSCAQNVSAAQGLTDVQRGDAQLEVRSVVGDAASYDALTVSLAPAKRGPQLVVGGATYTLRQLSLGGVGESSGRAEWAGVAPSERVAAARDAVLAQCGTLGR